MKINSVQVIGRMGSTNSKSRGKWKVQSRIRLATRSSKSCQDLLIVLENGVDQLVHACIESIGNNSFSIHNSMTELASTDCKLEANLAAARTFTILRIKIVALDLMAEIFQGGKRFWLSGKKFSNNFGEQRTRDRRRIKNGDSKGLCCHKEKLTMAGSRSSWQRRSHCCCCGHMCLFRAACIFGFQFLTILNIMAIFLTVVTVAVKFIR